MGVKGGPLHVFPLSPQAARWGMAGREGDTARGPLARQLQLLCLLTHSAPHYPSASRVTTPALLCVAHPPADNKMGADGGQAFADALKENKSLTQLDVQCMFPFNLRWGWGSGMGWEAQRVAG